MAKIIPLDGERVTRDLFQAHEDEALNWDAEFLDFGWFSERNRIFSKTSRGILESRINPSTMRIVHFWSHRRVGPINLDECIA